MSEEEKPKGEFVVLSREQALDRLDALMRFQYGETREEVEEAWKELCGGGDSDGSDPGPG